MDTVHIGIIWNGLQDTVQERNKEVEDALRKAFSSHIERKKSSYSFLQDVVDELATAIIRYQGLKPLLASCNIAAPNCWVDLGIKILTHMALSLDRNKGYALAGYLMPEPPYVGNPFSLLLLDKVSYVDKEVPEVEGAVGKQFCRLALSKNGFKKRKFIPEGEEYEIDAAHQKAGSIKIGIDIKRIEARRDTHKAMRRIVNKANKFKKPIQFLLCRFYLLPFHRWTCEHSEQIESIKIDLVVFASQDKENIANTCKMVYTFKEQPNNQIGERHEEKHFWRKNFHHLYQADARSFPYIEDESIHLVVTSPHIGISKIQQLGRTGPYTWLRNFTKNSKSLERMFTGRSPEGRLYSWCKIQKTIRRDGTINADASTAGKLVLTSNPINRFWMSNANFRGTRTAQNSRRNTSQFNIKEWRLGSSQCETRIHETIWKQKKGEKQDNKGIRQNGSHNSGECRSIHRKTSDIPWRTYIYPHQVFLVLGRYYFWTTGFRNHYILAMPRNRKEQCWMRDGPVIAKWLCTD